MDKFGIWSTRICIWIITLILLFFFVSTVRAEEEKPTQVKVVPLCLSNTVGKNKVCIPKIYVDRVPQRKKK